MLILFAEASKKKVRAALTVVGEDVAADALVHHVALGEHLVSLPLNSAAVLRDQAGYGSLIQHVSGRPLWRTRRQRAVTPLSSLLNTSCCSL